MFLRTTHCNFGELANKSEIADFFIFCQEKPFSELLLKTAFKRLKEFFFLRYPAKCENPSLGPREAWKRTEKSCMLALAWQQIEASHSNHLLYGNIDLSLELENGKIVQK